MSKLNPNPMDALRKIPAKSGSIRGKSPKGKAFESLLERDFYVLLEFDPCVAEFYPQVVKVPYINEAGKTADYYPDTLIHYRPDISAGTVPCSVLAEVKPFELLEKPSPKLALQIAAATAYAKDRGWKYQVFTEREIRSPFLDNALFLRPFEHRVPSPELRALILNRLFQLREPDVETLVAAIYTDKWNRAGLIPYIWHLVWARDIYADLSQPLLMTSPIWKNKTAL